MVRPNNILDSLCMCYIGDSSIYSAAITESVPPERLGSAMAVQAFLGLVGGGGPIVLGLVFDMMTGYIK